MVRHTHIVNDMAKGNQTELAQAVLVETGEAEPGKRTFPAVVAGKDTAMLEHVVLDVPGEREDACRTPSSEAEEVDTPVLVPVLASVWQEDQRCVLVVLGMGMQRMDVPGCSMARRARCVEAGGLAVEESIPQESQTQDCLVGYRKPRQCSTALLKVCFAHRHSLLQLLAFFPLLHWKLSDLPGGPHSDLPRI